MEESKSARGTFDAQPTLPRLPVPHLDATLDAYMLAVSTTVPPMLELTCFTSVLLVHADTPVGIGRRASNHADPGGGL